MKTLHVESCCCRESQTPRFSAVVGDILLVANTNGLEEVVLYEFTDGGRICVRSLHDETNIWEIPSSAVRALVIGD